MTFLTTISDSLADRLPELSNAVQQVAGKQIPIALAVLAAALVTVLFFRAQRGKDVAELEQEKATEKRSYTKAEVAEHNTADDVWIILKEKVYNVSPYVKEHPGGAAILRNAGKDSTKGFYGPQHPERVFDLIDDFYIGDLH